MGEPPEPVQRPTASQRCTADPGRPRPGAGPPGRRAARAGHRGGNRGPAPATSCWSTRRSAWAGTPWPCCPRTRRCGSSASTATRRRCAIAERRLADAGHVRPGRTGARRLRPHRRGDRRADGVRPGAGRAVRPRRLLGAAGHVRPRVLLRPGRAAGHADGPDDGHLRRRRRQHLPGRGTHPDPAGVRRGAVRRADRQGARRRARAPQPFTTSARLVELVRASIPAATRRTGGNPAKRTFQALRIEVNDELGALRRAIPAALQHLSVAGRIVVMSYQSLEDRIVKRAIAPLTVSRTPLGLPVDLPGHDPEFALADPRRRDSRPSRRSRSTPGPPRRDCARRNASGGGIVTTDPQVDAPAREPRPATAAADAGPPRRHDRRGRRADRRGPRGHRRTDRAEPHRRRRPPPRRGAPTPAASAGSSGWPPPGGSARSPSPRPRWTGRRSSPWSSRCSRAGHRRGAVAEHDDRRGGPADVDRPREHQRPAAVRGGARSATWPCSTPRRTSPARERARAGAGRRRGDARRGRHRCRDRRRRADGWCPGRRRRSTPSPRRRGGRRSAAAAAGRRRGRAAGGRAAAAEQLATQQAAQQAAAEQAAAEQAAAEQAAAAGGGAAGRGAAGAAEQAAAEQAAEQAARRQREQAARAGSANSGSQAAAAQAAGGTRAAAQAASEPPPADPAAPVDGTQP